MEFFLWLLIWLKCLLIIVHSQYCELIWITHSAGLTTECTTTLCRSGDYRVLFHPSVVYMLYTCFVSLNFCRIIYWKVSVSSLEIFFLIIILLIMVTQEFKPFNGTSFNCDFTCQSYFLLQYIYIYICIWHTCL